MLTSKLVNALTFYLRSRKVDGSYKDLFDLMCSDRLKELIPKSCLDFVLSQEKDDWLKPTQLSTVIDTYLASHFPDGRPKGTVTPAVYKYEEKGYKKPFSKPFTAVAVKPESKAEYVSVDKGGDNKSGRGCFVCGGPHMKRDCPKRKEGVHAKEEQNSGSGYAAGGKKFTNTAKTNVCAAGPQSTAMSDGGQMSSVAQQGAQACCSKIMPEFVSPKPLVARLASESALSVDCVNNNDSHNTIDNNHRGGGADCNNDCDEPFVDASDAEFYQCQYAMIDIKNLSQHRALIDSGSNVSCINAELIKGKSLPVVKQIYLSGLSGQPTLVDVVKLHLKLVVDETNYVNIAPAIHTFFAVVSGLNEEVIITPTVYQLLCDVAKYDVLVPVTNRTVDETPVVVNTTVEQSLVDQGACIRDVRGVNVGNCTNVTMRKTVDTDNLDFDDGPVVSNSDNYVQSRAAFHNGDTKGNEQNFVDPEIPDKHSSRSATAEELAKEQKACQTLQEFWNLAGQNKG